MPTNCTITEGSQTITPVTHNYDQTALAVLPGGARLWTNVSGVRGNLTSASDG